ncbi:hypothetical protein [Bradyrhizobium sp. 930_D9_N1_4]|uniref:hypothetical protein n=1 Tax=Bradyrhizobium sp. 930_D9_N1_4 TaxID=3240374 RepID=UPI003F8A6890
MKKQRPAQGRPFVDRSRESDQAAFIGMHIIIMPPQHIIMGMPICIMLIMLSQDFMNMSFMDGSIGVISQVMPAGVMVHLTWQGIIIGMPIMFIIGIMLPAIAGFIMPPIIIGMGIICIAVFILSFSGIRAGSSRLRCHWR